MTYCLSFNVDGFFAGVASNKPNINRQKMLKNTGFIDLLFNLMEAAFPNTNTL